MGWVWVKNVRPHLIRGSVRENILFGRRVQAQPNSDQKAFFSSGFLTQNHLPKDANLNKQRHGAGREASLLERAVDSHFCGILDMPINSLEGVYGFVKEVWLSKSLRVPARLHTKRRSMVGHSAPIPHQLPENPSWLSVSLSGHMFIKATSRPCARVVWQTWKRCAFSENQKDTLARTVLLMSRSDVPSRYHGMALEARQRSTVVEHAKETVF